MTLRAVILAGQRPGIDALSEAHGVGYKADIPICGRPMLDYVANALDEAGIARPFAITGYPVSCDGFTQAPSGDGPADSAILATQNGPFPILLTTCDHALLTPEIVRSFVAQAESSGADMAVGLASQETISAAYPKTTRTYLRFSDVAVSGCNLFYLSNERAVRALNFWRKAQHLRKKPLRLALSIGGAITIRYGLGRLTIGDAFAYASKRVGAELAPVFLDVAEAAIDVDTIADKALVEEILLRRMG